MLRRRGKRDSGGLPIERPAQPYGSQIEVILRPAAGCGPATATGEGRPGCGQRLPSCEGRQSLPAVWRSGCSSVNPGRFSGASCRSLGTALHALLQTRPSGSRAEGGKLCGAGIGRVREPGGRTVPTVRRAHRRTRRWTHEGLGSAGHAAPRGHEPPGSPGRVRFRET